MFGQATAQSRCQTSCSSKVIWKKIKFLDVESCWARAPVPHSWRSQCSRIKRSTNPDNSRSFWTVIWNLFTDFRFGVYIAPVSSFSLNDIGSSWTASFVLTLCRSVASQSHSNLSTCIEYLYYIIRSLSRYNSPSARVSLGLREIIPYGIARHFIQYALIMTNTRLGHSVVYTVAYHMTCNVSVYPRMTAVQLPGNWFELADERCCYAMACWVYCW